MLTLLLQGFAGCLVIKKLPANALDRVLSLVQGRGHIPLSSEALCTTATELKRSPCKITEQEHPAVCK